MCIRTIFQQNPTEMECRGGSKIAKILIVDDQACVRELLSEELTDEGHSVISSGCAKSAVEQLRFSRPDLVLLDLYLDNHKGWDVLGDIKRRDPRLPVLIVTAYDTFVNDPRLSQADGYVIKSFNLDNLKQEVAKILCEKPARVATEDPSSFPLKFGIAHS
jgi:DNA-binding NtrC family response regulator